MRHSPTSPFSESDLSVLQPIIESLDREGTPNASNLYDGVERNDNLRESFQAYIKARNADNEKLIYRDLLVKLYLNIFLEWCSVYLNKDTEHQFSYIRIETYATLAKQLNDLLAYEQTNIPNNSKQKQLLTQNFLAGTCCTIATMTTSSLIGQVAKECADIIGCIPSDWVTPRRKASLKTYFDITLQEERAGVTRYNLPPYDLRQPPTPLAGLDPNREVTIGDLHGNGLRLVHTLIREGILKQRAGGRSISEIYNHLQDAYYNRATSEEDFFNIAQACLNELEFDPNACANFRFIGDVLADRGRSDAFTLSIIKRMFETGVKYTWMMGNHDHDFLTGLLLQDKIILDVSRMSYNRVSDSEYLKRQIFNPAFINKIMFQQSKLIDYTLQMNEGKLTNVVIYHHAPIGLETIRGLYHHYYAENIAINTTQDLCAAIDAINAAYQKQGMHAFTQQAFEQCNKVHYSGTVRLALDANHAAAYPLEAVLWNRDYAVIRLPKLMDTNTEKEIPIISVYGHDSKNRASSIVAQQQICLDQKAGKGASGLCEDDCILSSSNSGHAKPAVHTETHPLLPTDSDPFEQLFHDIYWKKESERVDTSAFTESLSHSGETQSIMPLLKASINMKRWDVFLELYGLADVTDNQRHTLLLQAASQCAPFGIIEKLFASTTGEYPSINHRFDVIIELLKHTPNAELWDEYWTLIEPNEWTDDMRNQCILILTDPLYYCQDLVEHLLNSPCFKEHTVDDCEDPLFYVNRLIACYPSAHLLTRFLAGRKHPDLSSAAATALTRGGDEQWHLLHVMLMRSETIDDNLLLDILNKTLNMQPDTAEKIALQDKILPYLLDHHRAQLIALLPRVIAHANDHNQTLNASAFDRVIGDITTTDEHVNLFQYAYFVQDYPLMTQLAEHIIHAEPIAPPDFNNFNTTMCYRALSESLTNAKLEVEIHDLDFEDRLDLFHVLDNIPVLSDELNAEIQSMKTTVTADLENADLLIKRVDTLCENQPKTAFIVWQKYISTVSGASLEAFQKKLKESLKTKGDRYDILLKELNTKMHDASSDPPEGNFSDDSSDSDDNDDVLANTPISSPPIPTDANSSLDCLIALRKAAAVKKVVGEHLELLTYKLKMAIARYAHDLPEAVRDRCNALTSIQKKINFLGSIGMAPTSGIGQLDPLSLSCLLLESDKTYCLEDIWNFTLQACPSYKSILTRSLNSDAYHKELLDSESRTTLLPLINRLTTPPAGDEAKAVMAGAGGPSRGAPAAGAGGLFDPTCTTKSRQVQPSPDDTQPLWTGPS